MMIICMPNLKKHSSKKNDNWFTVTAEKRFDSSVFTEVDLVNNDFINNTGWWDCFVNWVKSVTVEIKNVIIKDLRLALNIAVNFAGLEKGAKLLSMYKDSYGNYHADFNAWQSIG